jgi:hypothetical protein
MRATTGFSFRRTACKHSVTCAHHDTFFGAGRNCDASTHPSAHTRKNFGSDPGNHSDTSDNSGAYA